MVRAVSRSTVEDKDDTMNQQLFAFWKYDVFPYILGAAVLEMKSDGRVVVEGYGGAAFQPVKLLPLDAGRKLWEQLKELRIEHDVAEQRLRAESLRKAREIASFIPKT